MRLGSRAAQTHREPQQPNEATQHIGRDGRYPRSNSLPVYVQALEGSYSGQLTPAEPKQGIARWATLHKGLRPIAIQCDLGPPGYHMSRSAGVAAKLKVLHTGVSNELVSISIVVADKICS